MSHPLLYIQLKLLLILLTLMECTSVQIQRRVLNTYLHQEQPDIP